jgi:hypothetical protein
MNIKTFSQYKLNENLDDQLKDKLSDKYLSLKRDVLLLIDGTLDDNQKKEMVNVQNFLADIEKNGVDNIKINGFIEDSDIQNFYLKHKDDVDLLLKDKGYFNGKTALNVYGLYDIMINGTKKAVQYIIEILNDEIF